MLTHRLFPEARYSIWVDSKYQFRRDPIAVLEALLWRTNSTFAISEHGARSNIYDEGKAIVQKHKATPEEVEVQLTQYRQDGMPGVKRLYGLKGQLFSIVFKQIFRCSCWIFLYFAVWTMKHAWYNEFTCLIFFSSSWSLYYCEGAHTCTEPFHVCLVQWSGSLHISGSAQFPICSVENKHAWNEHVSCMLSQGPCEQFGSHKESKTSYTD